MNKTMNFTIILVHSGKSFGDAKEFSQETIETIIAPIEKKFSRETYRSESLTTIKNVLLPRKLQCIRT